MRFIDAIMRSSGWRARAIGFGSGALGALALPPFGFFPAMVAPLVVAVWRLDGLSASGNGPTWRAAFGVGWWMGFGYFVAGLWWLGAAFLVDAKEFAWALPFGVAGLPAVLAIFTGCGTLVAHALWRPGSARILVFALALGASEWLRGVLFSGFPWNVYGMALGGHLVLAQAASLVGLHGLTLLALFIFASPAALFGDKLTRARGAPLAGLLLLSALTAFGAWRLAAHHTEYEDGRLLRIMQPNVAQDENFTAENRDAIIARYLAVSSERTSEAPEGLANVSHLIWPESAFPFFLGRDGPAREQISAALGRTILITGAARVETAPGEWPGEIDRVSYFNAIQILGRGGAILDSYDKNHLVPFGEYLPFSGLLESWGLRQFVQIPGGFDAGASRRLLTAPGLPGIAPLVCYEAVFPGAVSSALRGSAGLMLNVSNDGWFGETAGPHQHLAQARLRSIEEGLPMLRAANTGISAAIDPYGRILKSLPLGAAGVIDTPLMKPADPPLAARYPVGAPAALFGLFLVIAAALRVQR